MPLAPDWRACIRMIVADYCGNGQPTTREGILISFYDELGINPADPGPNLPFEAAWDESGAICVAHPRVPQNVTLRELVTSCPRLAGRLGANCSEVAARQLGTPLLFNGSYGDGVPEPRH